MARARAHLAGDDGTAQRQQDVVEQVDQQAPPVPLVGQRADGPEQPGMVVEQGQGAGSAHTIDHGQGGGRRRDGREGPAAADQQVCAGRAAAAVDAAPPQAVEARQGAAQGRHAQLAAVAADIAPG